MVQRDAVAGDAHGFIVPDRRRESQEGKEIYLLFGPRHGHEAHLLHPRDGGALGGRVHALTSTAPIEVRDPLFGQHLNMVEERLRAVHAKGGEVASRDDRVPVDVGPRDHGGAEVEGGAVEGALLVDPHLGLFKAKQLGHALHKGAADQLVHIAQAHADVDQLAPTGNGEVGGHEGDREGSGSGGLHVPMVPQTQAGSQAPMREYYY